MPSDLRSLLQHKSVLVFDYDQTLVDSAELHAAAFVAALRKFDLEVDYSDIAGLSTIEAMRRILSRHDLDMTDEEIMALASAKQAVARESYGEKLELMPGAKDFVCWAKDRYKLAIFSSGSRSAITTGLEKFGFEGLFDPIVSAESVAQHKPDPAGLNLVQRMTNATAPQMLLFDDSPHGRTAALALGVDFIDVVATPFDEMIYR